MHLDVLGVRGVYASRAEKVGDANPLSSKINRVAPSRTSVLLLNSSTRPRPRRRARSRSPTRPRPAVSRRALPAIAVLPGAHARDPFRCSLVFCVGVVQRWQWGHVGGSKSVHYFAWVPTNWSLELASDAKGQNVSGLLSGGVPISRYLLSSVGGRGLRGGHLVWSASC